MLCLCRSKHGLHMVVLELPQQNLQRLVSAAGARGVVAPLGGDYRVGLRVGHGETILDMPNPEVTAT